MAKNTSGVSRKPRTSVKAPLIFSAVLAVIAGVAVFVFSTGGATKEPRIDLGLIAAGVAFVVSLVVCAMLMMAEKPNDEHLGAGSGVNLRSSDLRPGQKPGAPRSGSHSDEPGAETSDKPQYGQRVSGTERAADANGYGEGIGSKDSGNDGEDSRS